MNWNDSQSKSFNTAVRNNQDNQDHHFRYRWSITIDTKFHYANLSISKTVDLNRISPFRGDFWPTGKKILSFPIETKCGLNHIWSVYPFQLINSVMISLCYFESNLYLMPLPLKQRVRRKLVESNYSWKGNNLSPSIKTISEFSPILYSQKISPTVYISKVLTQYNLVISWQMEKVKDLNII